MQLLKRFFSGLFAFILVFSLFPAAEAKTGQLVKNSGTRHEVCTALSSQAQAYYTGSYVYDAVSALSASASDPMHSEMFSRLHTLMDSAPTPITPPESGDYVLHIDGGSVKNHLETVDGVSCLRVDVRIEGVTAQLPLSSLSFDLGYDPTQLVLHGYTGFEGSMGYVNANEPGLVRYTFISVNGSVHDPDTPLLTLYFAITDAGAEADRFDFLFCGNFDASSVDPVTHYTVLCTLGAVVRPYLMSVFYGDANCDGRITSADAAVVLRSAVGLAELSGDGRLNACVNGNAEPTAADAAAILRYAVGLVDRFPID